MMTYVNNETYNLKKVVVGIGNSFKEKNNKLYDAKSKWALKNGIYPDEKNIKIELDRFSKVLEDNKVEVYRPDNFDFVNQIFSRDIGFVIENKFFISNTIRNKKIEQDILLQSNSFKKFVENIEFISLPENIIIEGGDVILYNDIIFVGYSDDNINLDTVRTNYEAVKYLKKLFEHKTIIPFKIKKDDNNPFNGALHLDCCFQPFGKNNLLLHEKSFAEKQDLKIIHKYFDKKNIIYVNDDEAVCLATNIFSISENILISEKRQKRVNKEIEKKGVKVIEVDFYNTSLLGGLFRCSTLPILRNK